jgi:hypothetical protein
VQTSDFAVAGDYHIQVTGTLPSHQFATNMYAYIELYNIDPREYITP